ncbi:MAG: DUF2064 domain-containing protein [Maribacter sp.]
MNSLPTTAILLFANSARQELEHKPIAKGEGLFDTLTQQTLKKAKRTGLPVFHFTEKEQTGSGFGERFTNAITTIFEKGFENVITIGNDTPQLKVHHLTTTAEALAHGKTVIGPSADGGFYLMGFQKENFNATALKNMPWQRMNLFSRISIWLKNASSEIEKLPVLQDIDDVKDLKTILRFSRSISLSLLQLILGVLGCSSISLLFQIDGTHLYLNRSLYNKGSPMALLA